MPSLPSHLRSRLSETTVAISKDRLNPIVEKFQSMLPKGLEMIISGNYQTGFYLTWNAAEQFGPALEVDVEEIVNMTC